ncbi:MAG: tetratricopeptide repeat protein [Methylophaga sp.]|nr:tetratricopeptide repeat protein [Methylophaga sp.]
MDLMQSFLRGAGQRLKHAGLIGMPLFLLACASTPAQQAGAPEAGPAENKMETVATETDAKPEQPKQYMPLSPELMYYILSAEVAGQRGQIGIAVDLYQRAAEMVESPALASRSAQVASLSRDQQRINDALERWIEVDPNDADVYIMQAPFLMLKDNYQGAVNAVNKALELAPDKKKTYLIRVSENLAEVAEPDEALNMLKQLDSYQQNDPAARFAYARMAFFYKRYEETLNKLAPLLEADPDNEDYLVLKADTLQRMGRSEEALKLIAKAAKKDDASQDLRFTYGKLLGENGETEQAHEVFETILADDPDNRDALFALGLLALEDKDGQLAKSYFSELLKLGDPTYQASYFMGLAEEMNGNIDAALVWFASVPVQSNRFDVAQSNYIKLLIERGELAKARVHLAQLREELPQQALQYYLFEASLLREQGQSQAAFDLLSEAIKRYPQSEDLRYSRAMIAESLDKLDVLEADLRWILERDPNNAQALNALGYTLTDRTERHQEALDMITRALELKPGDPFYLDSLGWVYYRLGDLEKAEKYLREAMNVQPDVEFIAHLGEVLWERGKKQEARQIWQKGLEKDADNQLLRDTMRRFGL